MVLKFNASFCLAPLSVWCLVGGCAIILRVHYSINMQLLGGAGFVEFFQEKTKRLRKVYKDKKMNLSAREVRQLL